MKRFFMTVMVLGVMAFLLTSVVHADDDLKGKDFIGIWQGVSNGGLITVDISNLDGDEEFRIQVSLQGFTPLCNGLNDEGVPIELGHLRATTLTPGTINANGDLIFNETLTCSATERPIGPEIIETTFRLIDDNTILDVGPGIPLQRISALPKDDD